MTAHELHEAVARAIFAVEWGDRWNETAIDNSEHCYALDQARAAIRLIVDEAVRVCEERMRQCQEASKSAAFHNLDLMNAWAYEAGECADAIRSLAPTTTTTEDAR